MCLFGARERARDKNMVQETNGEARPATPDAEQQKKRGSNLLASAGVNFERRYKSNQSAQNYHVGQSEVRATLFRCFFSAASPLSRARLFAHSDTNCRTPPLNSHRRCQLKTIGQTLSPLSPNNKRPRKVLSLAAAEIHCVLF